MQSIVLIGLLTALSGKLSVLIWHCTPALWFCDYGVKPGEAESAPRGKDLLFRVRCYTFFFLWAAAAVMLYFPAMTTAERILSMIAVMTAFQIALADMQFKIIPDQWTAIFGAVLALQSALDGKLWTFLKEALLAVAVLWIGCILFQLLSHKFLLGFGDVKLIFALGLGGGGTAIIESLVTASLLCGAVCSLAVLLKKKSLTDTCAFGPYLLAAWVLLPIIEM